MGFVQLDRYSEIALVLSQSEKIHLKNKFKNMLQSRSGDEIALMKKKKLNVLCD